MTALAAPYCYPYPRPAVTVDVVLFRVVNKEVEVLLIQRKHDPFQDHWAHPGGFVDENERLIDAAQRELKEETGLENVVVVQFGAFGDAGRDPRGWTIAIGFVGFLRHPSVQPLAGDDAQNAAWFPVGALPKLAFDHRAILTVALRHVQSDSLLTCAIAAPGHPEHLGRAQRILQKAILGLESPDAP